MFQFLEILLLIFGRWFGTIVQLQNVFEYEIIK